MAHNLCSVFLHFPFGHLAQPKSNINPWTMRLRVALGIAKGLSYLHHSSQPPVAHGCLHPGNVLLDARLEPYLADVALVKLVFGKSDLHMTQAGVGYAAPGIPKF